MTLTTSMMRHRSAVAFAMRLTVAALLALWIGRWLEVQLPLWVVLTAMIVTQTSLGRSLKVALDYFSGTILGALWGGLVVMLVPAAGAPAMLATLGLALAPLAFLMAVRPRYATAPITAAIVVLMAQTTPLTPLGSVLERLLEVGLGGGIGLLVSLFLLPSSAFQQFREKAAEALEEMATTALGLSDGFGQGLDRGKSRTLQLAIGPLLTELRSVFDETENEKGLRLGSEDPGPLLRSLLRLRHDLVIVGRAVEQPLPAGLAPSFALAGTEIQAYFKNSAASLRTHLPAPPIESVEASIMSCTAAVDRARRAGELRNLSSDEVEHLFAMGFALEQMRRNLVDLNRCINEWAS